MDVLVEQFFGASIGGFTTNHTWVDINLNRLGTSLEKLAQASRTGLPFPIVVFPAGGYVAIVQGTKEFQQAQMCFIHFSLDAEEYYVFFSQFTPQTYRAIFETQRLIARRGEAYQQSVTLTDAF